ncbi:MAG: hypothetical protein AAGC46_05330 [Solirubrobacteraceae bacterium]|nr:hypothetical protein [Patulibacter sp.]
MSPDAQATDHVFTPFLVRAQLVMGGLVLTTGAALAGVGAIDLSALRSFLGY